MCSGINREEVEDLFGKNFLSYDTNVHSRGAPQPVVGGPNMKPVSGNAASFPSMDDFESLDDVVNVANALRFLCINKWSALGDSFLECTVVGSPSTMQRSMLSTRQNNVHWNEEWID